MFAKITAARFMVGAARLVVLAAVLVALGATAQAQQPKQAQQKQAPALPPTQPLPPEPSANAIKIAREILELKQSDVVFAAMVPGVIERVKSMLLQTTPTLGKDLEAVALNLRKAFASRTNDLMNDIAWLYASRFTEAELKEIVTFYRTSAGKKAIELEPAVFEDAMSGLKGWQEKFGEEVIGRFRAEMKKRGHDL
jgi:hypothetical protein